MAVRRRRRISAIVGLGLVVTAASVALDRTPAAAAPPVNCAAFVVSGNPRTSTGATWTYQSTDLGVQEGIRLLDRLAERPTPVQVLERAQAWAPLRSVASWVLWRLTDQR